MAKLTEVQRAQVVARIVGWDPAAEYLDISRRHLERLQQERRIPHVRVGGRIKFDLNALDAWIAENQVEAES